MPKSIRGRGLPRRRFLAGAAGFTLSAAAITQQLGFTRAADGLPRRFVFVVEGNCLEPVTLLSEEARSALDGSLRSPVADRRHWEQDYRHDTPLEIPNSGLATARCLGALAGSAELASLAERSMVVYGLSSKVTGGGHSTGSGCLTASRPSGSSPSGPSIDAQLAALPAVRQGAPFEAVRLGIAPNSFSSRLNYATCAIARGRPAPLIVDPTTAYVNLFASVDSAHQSAFEQRSDLLDIAFQRTSAKLQGFPADCTQRDKLLVYRDSLQELQERQGILEGLRPQLSSAREALQHLDALSSTVPHERLSAQFDMATAALVSGLSNVAVLGIGTGGAFDIEYPDYPMPDVDNKRHDYHHLAQNAGNAQDFRRTIHDVSSFYLGLTATLARALDAVEEEGGTMLDNTAIVYLSGNGEQHHSSASEFATLIVGGKNLGLRTDGRTVVYPGLSAGASHRQLSSLFTTLAHAAGNEIPRFGGEGATLIAEGPLTEVWGA